LYGDRGKVELVPSALGGLRINIAIPAVEVLQYD